MKCLDTQIFVWGVRDSIDDVKPADREKAVRARILLDMLGDAQIVLPSIVLTELLRPMDHSKHAGFIAKAKESFLIVEFNEFAASRSAQLWALHRQQNPDTEDRQRLRHDVLVVGTAWSVNVREFYSDDRRCRALAALAGITAKELPPKHDNMFIDQELRRGASLASLPPQKPKEKKPRCRGKRKRDSDD